MVKISVVSGREIVKIVDSHPLTYLSAKKNLKICLDRRKIIVYHLKQLEINAMSRKKSDDSHGREPVDGENRYGA